MSVLCCCGSRRRLRETNDEQQHVSSSQAPLPGDLLVREADIWLEQSREPTVNPNEPDTSPTNSSPALFGNSAQSAQIVIDDFESDVEQEWNTSSIKTNSALDIVKSKLIRHMSHENNLACRTRAQPGSSEEEIARRAELKRFRHKRIQDELKNQEAHDDSSNTSHRSTRYLSPLIDIGQPRSGPRDTIEFVVDSGHHLPALSASPMPSFNSISSIHEGVCDPNQRRSSCPETSKSRDNDEKLESAQISDTFIHKKAPSSTSPPKRPASAQNSTYQVPAGCMYGSPRLDRVLGADNEFDIRHGSHAWEEQSALGIWLIAQGLRSRDESMLSHEEPECVETAARDGFHASTPDFGGLDRVVDTPTPTGKQGLTVPCNSAESLDKTYILAQEQIALKPGCSSPSGTIISNPPRLNLTTISDGTTSADASIKMGEENGLAVGVARPIENSSSSYPSVMPSFQPSPARSQPNLHYLSMQDLENLELSPFRWHGNHSVIRAFGPSDERSSYETAEDFEASNFNKIHMEMPKVQSTMTRNQSPTLSDTASFHQREAELKTIEKRFGEALTRKKLVSSTTSRFREEFNQAGITQARKPSFMERFNISISKRSKQGPDRNEVTGSKNSPIAGVGMYSNVVGGDGAVDHANFLGLGIMPELSSAQASDIVSAGRVGTATFLQHQKPREKNKGLANLRQVSNPHQSYHFKSSPTTKSTKPFVPKWRSYGHRPSMSSLGTDVEMARLTPPPSEIPFPEPRDPSRQMFRRWAANMHPGMSLNCEVPITHGSLKCPPRATIPPPAWSIYPLHNQAEITDHNALDRHTNSKLLEIEAPHLKCEERHKSEKECGFNSVRNNESGPHSLPVRLGKAVRSGLVKLMPGKTTTSACENQSCSRNVPGSCANNRSGSQSLALKQDSAETVCQASNIHNLVIATTKYNLQSADMDASFSSSTGGIGNRTFHTLSQDAKTPDHDADESMAGVDLDMTPTSAVSISYARYSDGEPMADVFVTPLSRMRSTDMSNVDMQCDSESITSNIRAAAMRRWKSTSISSVAKRASSTWADRSASNL